MVISVSGARAGISIVIRMLGTRAGTNCYIKLLYFICLLIFIG